MSGDSSDTIDGVRGIGIKTAIKFLSDYGSFENLWSAYDRGEAMKGVKLLSVTTAAARSIYDRNRVLMDWRRATIPSDVFHTMMRPDINAAVSIADEYGMKNLSAMLSKLVLPQSAWQDRLYEIDDSLRGNPDTSDDEFNEQTSPSNRSKMRC